MSVEKAMKMNEKNTRNLKNNNSSMNVPLWFPLAHPFLEKQRKIKQKALNK